MKSSINLGKNINNHIVYRVNGFSKFTGNPVYTYEVDRENADTSHIFYVIVCKDSKKDRFYTGRFFTPKTIMSRINGTYGKKVSEFSNDASDAMFYLDRQAAEEEICNVRDSVHNRLTVSEIELDFVNELPSAEFLIICEDRVRGKLSYFEKIDRERNVVVTADKSTFAGKLGFRACLAVAEELRANYKKYKYSVLPADIFDIEVRAKDIMNFLRRNPPKKSLALSFKLNKEKDGR